MKQVHHSNATTNIHIRSLIHNSSLSNYKLSNQLQISQNTVSKWKNRTAFEDKSSSPNTINYSLSEVEKAVVVSVRTSTWWALDEIVEMVYSERAKEKRSAVYRVFVANNINKVPQKEKEKAKKFKEYAPGFLHLDVTYLPKINGIKYYLYVVIDRATRTMYYKIYNSKTALNTKDFILEAADFLPFNITHILTDNGLEFTNKLITSKKGKQCGKYSLLDEFCTENDIEHRLTKPNTPKTNGMVERLNGTIKNNTVKINQYANLEEMQSNLTDFLINYNLYRRHSGLRKELNVKTPINAIEKWFELEPDCFKENPLQFKNKVLLLYKGKQEKKQQPYET